MVLPDTSLEEFKGTHRVIMLASFATIPALNKMNRTAWEYCVNSPCSADIRPTLRVKLPKA